MESTFVSQQTTTGATDFDRILASIAGGISDYLGKPAPQVVLVPAPVVMPVSAANTDWVMLAIIAGGIYLFLR